MTRYYLEITCRVRGIPAEDLEELFKPLADAVYDLNDVIDADLGTDTRAGTVEFTMAVDTDTEVDALGRGLSAVRCALHAAGGATPGWERHFETIKNVVSREPVVA